MISFFLAALLNASPSVVDARATLAAVCPELIQPEADSVTRARGWLEFRQGHSSATRVKLSTCEELGFSLAFEYIGGIQIGAAVEVKLTKNNKPAEWAAFSAGEQAWLLKEMGARTAPAPVLWPFQAAQWHDTVSMPHVFAATLPRFHGVPHDEPQVFMPTTQVLYLGARVTKRAPLGALRQFSVAYAPTATRPFIGRVYGPPVVSVFCDLHDDCTMVPQQQVNQFGAPLPASPARVVAPDVFFFDGLLIDFPWRIAYAFQSPCVADSCEAVALDDDGMQRVTVNPKGQLEVIDFLVLVGSAGTDGVSTIEGDAAIEWALEHRRLGALAGLYLATNGASAVLTALEQLPGWESAPSRPVTIAARARRRTVVVTGLPFGFTVSAPRAILLGYLNTQALLLQNEGRPEVNAPPNEVLSVARADVLSLEATASIEALRKTLFESSVCVYSVDDYCPSYPITLSGHLARGNLTPAARARACQAEKQLLHGHDRAELLEILDAECEEWISDKLHRDDSPARICQEWKSLCR